MSKFIEKVKKFKEFYKSHKKVLVPLTIIILVCLVTVDNMYFEKSKPKEVTYNEFTKLVKEHKVDTVYYEGNSEDMRFTLYNEHTKGKTKKELKEENYTYPDSDWRMTQYPAGETFREDLLKEGVNLSVKKFEPISVKLLSACVGLALPLFIIILTWNIVSVQFNKGNAFELTKNIDTRFKDVIGHDEVIKDLKFLVDLMKEPNKYDSDNVKIPRGILFSGEPGTGKTLLARAMAGESNVPFYYMNASNFIEIFAGTGAKRVRALFKQAKKTQPCIIFIDEIDAIGCKRGSMHGTTEDTQTLNALLQEMDGFDKGHKILIIGATNNADRLDKALVRSGRFDRQIIISPPSNVEERLDLLKYFLKKTAPTDETVNLEVLAKQMIGYTGADIASVVNEAELIRLSNKQSSITMDNLEEAFDKKIMKGNRKKEDRHKEDLRIVAYHEAGHAITSYLLNMEIARATIIQTTSGVGGAVIHQESDNLLKTKEDYENRVRVCYGGRASEEIKFKQITTGASNDITQATRILDEYVNKLGFDKDFGLIDMSVLEDSHVTLEDNSLETIKGYSVKLYNETLSLLIKNYDLVEVIAKELLRKETLSGEAIKELLSDIK